MSFADIGYGEVDGFKGVNCRHDWLPYYEGSTRTHTKEKLDEYKNAKVIYNGKEMSLYDANQLQRRMERQIRADKKRIAGLNGILTSDTKDRKLLEETRDKLLNKQVLLKEHNVVLNDFIKQTGNRKDNTRLVVGKAWTNGNNGSIMTKNANKKENKMNYQEVTGQYANKKKYQVKKQKYFVADDGMKYNVDGKHVVLKPTRREIEVAEILGRAIGGRVNIIPRVSQPSGIKTPDYIINDERFDLKQITGGGKYTIQGNLKGKEKQSNNFVIDISKAKFDTKEAKRQIEIIYNSKHYLWLNKILLIKDSEIIVAYKRM